MSLFAVATGVTLLMPTVTQTEKYMRCTLSDTTARSCTPYNDRLLHVKKSRDNTSADKTSISDLSRWLQRYMKHMDKLATYRVQEGDTLAKIASRFHLPVTLLAKINKLENADFLKTGQTLVLPMDKKTAQGYMTGSYRIGKDESLISVAKRFDLDPNLLAQYNRIRFSGDVYEGRVLQLPFKERLRSRKKITIKKGKNRYIGTFGKHRLRVTATAYTSHCKQTDKSPFLAAWNNRLRPGMKAIAVSRDLIYRYGLKNGTKVKISGLPGIYTVKDKMNKRFRKRIDIYMGNNLRRALRWGRRSVVIAW